MFPQLSAILSDVVNCYHYCVGMKGISTVLGLDVLLASSVLSVESIVVPFNNIIDQ